MGVPRELVDALERDGKTTAFPIQADTLPDSLAGRDILGRGQTGSGKTLAFSIPLIARLAQSSDADDAIRDFNAIKNSGDKDARKKAMLPHPRALVLAPTRELVNQIDEVIRPLAEVYGMRTVTIYGGVRQGRQVDGLRRGAQIVVACPGRLEDLLNQKLLSLESVRVAVLDEADEMADMGFLPSVEKLLAQVAPDGQRMLFSATLDHGVDKLVDEFLHEPKVHAVDAADAQVDTLTQHVFKVTKDDKPEVIRALASGKDKRIIFTRTKYQAKELAEKLVKHGIPAVDLQGNLSQKQRDHHLAAFERGFVRVLVATDVAARGIDVSDVALVIQTEPPADPKSFLHRSGRTARAGEHGDVVTLVLPNQRQSSHRLFRNAGIDAKPVAVTPESPELLELVSEVAPVVEGWDLGQVDFGNKHGKHGKNRFDRGAGRRDDDMRDFGRSFRDGEMPHRHSSRRISSYDEGPRNREQRREREFGQRSGGWRHGGNKHRDDVRFVSAKHGKKTKASKKSKPAGKYHSGNKHAGGKKHR
nr:DEAD/DEAH box helicase [Bifidobacterium thermacidophilum]